jgi:hypothetical protein
MVSNVIPMPERSAAGKSKASGARDRRYTIRHPFAANAELVDLESGNRADGVTSDISLGGCFVCTSKPLPISARARVKLERKGETLEALVVVRIVKPRIGMGIEFIDIEAPYNKMLAKWIEEQRRDR